MPADPDLPCPHENFDVLAGVRDPIPRASVVTEQPAPIARLLPPAGDHGTWRVASVKPPARCVVCAAETSSDLYLCRGCVVGLQVELADIAGVRPANTLNGHGQLRGDVQMSLVEDLYVTMAKQDQLTRPGQGTSGGDGRWSAPVKDGLVPVLFALHETLRHWANTFAVLPIGTPTTALAGTLIDLLDLVAKSPDAAQLIREVTAAVHRARRAIDRPNDTRLFLGRCGARTMQGICDEELYGRPWLERARCHKCHAEHLISYRQEKLVTDAQSYLGTAVEISRFLRITGRDVTAETLRGLAHRGRLPARGTNKAGHPQYQIGEAVIALGNRYKRLTVS